MSAGASQQAMTLEALAEEAGVSISTISRALNGRPGVRADTADRIRALAEERGFSPNAAAAGLRRQTSNTLAIVVPALHQWYFSSVAAAAEAHLAESGFEMLVAVVPDDEGLERVVERAHPDHAELQSLVIVDLSVPDAVIDTMRDAGVGATFIGRSSPYFPSVMVDDVEVGRKATALLAGLGHRRIGLVQGAGESKFGFAVPRRRRSGYLAALDAFGIPHDPACEASGNFSIDGGTEATVALFDQPDPPTALFCMSDEMAFGATMALEGMGLTVPGDVSVIGVDDHPLARATGLTTIRQPVAEFGRLAAEIALAHADGDDEMQHVVLPTELVIRSTAAARR